MNDIKSLSIDLETYSDIDLSKFNLEEGKQELSNLEDLILTSSNIDQITDKYKTKKEY